MIISKFLFFHSLVKDTQIFISYCIFIFFQKKIKILVENTLKTVYYNSFTISDNHKTFFLEANSSKYQCLYHNPLFN